ncbi:putative Hedgehog signaling attenuator pxb isoform X2 [Rhynchophorus ferrugineus]
MVVKRKDESDSSMWDVLDAAADCDCPGPPPEFLLPPPPRPPSLQPADPMLCTDDALTIETCDALPLIDASYRSSPSSQTLAVIVFCSVLLGLLVFIIVILVWKHKRVQNLLPCKNSPQNNCDGAAATSLYEDVNDVVPRHHTTPHHHHHQLTGGHIVAPSIEMIDVKNNIHYPSGYPISQHPPVFLCSSPGPDPYCSQDLYNPVYEELSEPETELEHQSEDEFAEDELSLGGGDVDRRRLNVPPPPYRPCTGSMRREVPRFRRPHEPLPPLPNNRRNRSLERRKQEFHEGMLLDALLQIYPRVGSVEPPPPRRQIPSITQRIQCMGQYANPYESVPVISHLATFRPVPKLYSHDSALGSDSGYSNGTSRGSNRVCRDPRRLSQISADLTLT